MSQVPAATRALRVLRVLAAHPDPVPLERIAREVGMPRSSAYHLLAAMAGQFASHQDEGDEPELVEREDGSLLIAGAMAADALAERLGIDLPEDREFATAAGYVLFMLKRLPVEGDHFTDQGWRVEVVDMDGRKIDKLLVSEAAGGRQ